MTDAAEVQREESDDDLLLRVAEWLAEVAAEAAATSTASRDVTFQTEATERRSPPTRPIT